MDEDYDDSPWTREELQALAWERLEREGEDWDEYDCSPLKSREDDATLINEALD